MTKTLDHLYARFMASPNPDGTIEILTDASSRVNDTSARMFVHVETLTADSESQWVRVDNGQMLDMSLTEPVRVYAVADTHYETAVPVMFDVRHANPVVAALMAQQEIMTAIEPRTSLNIESWWFLDRDHKVVDGNDNAHGDIIFDRGRQHQTTPEVTEAEPDFIVIRGGVAQSTTPVPVFDMDHLEQADASAVRQARDTAWELLKTLSADNRPARQQILGLIEEIEHLLAEKEK